MALIYLLKQLLNPEDLRRKASPAAEYRNTEQNSLGEANRHVKMNQDTSALVAQLTPREYMLYVLLLEGYTLKEAAQQLGIRYSTANTHMTAIYRKLGVKSRAELIINYRFANREPASPT